MPNVCWNVLRISGNKEQLRDFIMKGFGDDIIKGTEEKAITFFNNLLPVPKKNVSKKEGILSDEEYEWRLKNWGTKWEPFGMPQSLLLDAMYSKKKGELFLKFFTAWTPPGNLLMHISPDFPKLSFDLQYREDDMGLKGWIVFENGEVVNDHSLADDPSGPSIDYEIAASQEHANMFAKFCKTVKEIADSRRDDSRK